jgi:hypothetical protein
MLSLLPKGSKQRTNNYDSARVPEGLCQRTANEKLIILHGKDCNNSLVTDTINKKI